MFDVSALMLRVGVGSDKGDVYVRRRRGVMTDRVHVAPAFVQRCRLEHGWADWVAHALAAVGFSDLSSCEDFASYSNVGADLNVVSSDNKNLFSYAGTSSALPIS